MPTTKPLTRAERAWLTDLQALLNTCPSERLGFYTIGDPCVTVFDRTQEDAIDTLLDAGKRDFCSASNELGADLAHLYFPAPVLSTAG